MPRRRTYRKWSRIRTANHDGGLPGLHLRPRPRGGSTGSRCGQRRLGVDLTDVRRDFITEAVARKIVTAHPELVAEDLVGQSIFSLFKAKCAEGTLKNSAGEQTLAPFAFISNLAGLLLALELVLVRGGRLPRADQTT